MRRLLFTLLLVLPLGLQAGTNVQGLLQMLDYVGVDYPAAVRDGRVVHQGEYEEMRDFANAIGEQVAGLPEQPAKPELVAEADRLKGLIAERAPAGAIAGLASAMRKRVLAHYEVTATPRRAPDLQAAERVYAEQCASCHGAGGRGDGDAAEDMDPAPIDFHDLARRDQRTLFGLYNTITLGVEDTEMQGFDGLTEDRRWDLAFYVAAMGAPAERVAAGKRVWREQGREAPLADLEKVATTSPEEARAEYGESGQALLAYLRRHPEVLLAAKGSPLDFAAHKLEESVALAREGDRKAAYEAAVTGYLEGFELAEGGLDAVAPDLRREIEAAMTDYRNAVRDGAPVAELAERVAAIEGRLETARQRLDEDALSGTTAFVGALVILLREGLEAILVVAALAAYLVRTGHRRGMAYLHTGWVAALVAGVATWAVSNYLIEIGGAGRELTEGIAALVAAAVLFYVGFWLHSKTAASQWKRFIEGSIHRALKASTLWSLAGLSFITVYREAFETILFYQALWVQTAASGKGMVVSGFAVAAVILVVLAWLILRFSAHLPLRQFFAVTGVLMLVLAVAFAGKGVAALQEAGKLPANPVGLPSIELLGIYPNLEGLGLQLLMVVAALALVFWGRQRAPSH